MIATPEFWVAFSFVVFVVLMIKTVRSTLFTKLDERALEIKKEINETEELKIQAEQLFAKYQEKQNSLSFEVEKIIQWAEAEAEALIVENKNRLEEELSRKLELSKQKFLIIENGLVKNSYNNMFSVVIQSAQSYLEKNLNNLEMQNIIFESSVSSLEDQLNLIKK
ncbi:MAG: hypothetical protein AB8U25_02195 [Rickettsiales endosymbiont of Dermacentor nuttalli]